MDEDFLDVTENSHKVGIILVIIICLIIVCGYFLVFKRYYFSIKNIEIELGSEVPTDVKYYLKDKVNYDDFKLDLSRVNADEVGEYTYIIKSKSTSRKGKIKIVDKTAPVFTLRDVTIEVGQQDFFLGDFLESCEDFSLPCLVTFKNPKDSEKIDIVGRYKVAIEVADTRGNKKAAEAVLNVVEKGSIDDAKAKDLEYHSNSEDIENFKGNILRKLTVGLPSGSDEESDLIAEVASIDLDKYIVDYYEGAQIKETTIIKLYNKYQYTIGISIQIVLKDGRTVYVEQGKVNGSDNEE